MFRWKWRCFKCFSVFVCLPLIRCCLPDNIVFFIARQISLGAQSSASSPLAGALLKVLVIYNLVHERGAPDSKWIMDQSIVPYRAWFFRSSSFIRCRCLRTINSRISGCAFYKYSPKLHRTANEENRWLTASRSFSRYMVFFYLCLVVVRRAAAGLWGWFMFGIMLLARNYEGTWNY